MTTRFFMNSNDTNLIYIFSFGANSHLAPLVKPPLHRAATFVPPRIFYGATNGRPLCIHSATTAVCVPSFCLLRATCEWQTSSATFVRLFWTCSKLHGDHGVHGDVWTSCVPPLSDQGNRSASFLPSTATWRVLWWHNGGYQYTTLHYGLYQYTTWHYGLYQYTTLLYGLYQYTTWHYALFQYNTLHYGLHQYTTLHYRLLSTYHIILWTLWIYHITL